VPVTYNSSVGVHNLGNSSPGSPAGRVDMTEAYKQWEGQIVKNEFPLLQYLGGDSQSAVFLTEHSEGTSRKAAIKLLSLDSGAAELQLSRWRLASQLSHPHLIRLFDMGRCEIGGVWVIYLVMEYAQQNLSQFVPRRLLSVVEAHGMLEPTLSVLAYLHGRGLVHGHIKPTNIMGVDDEFKLSSDSICRSGELVGSLRGPSPYDPLEGASRPAADIWALAMVLIESLTRHLPTWEGEASVLSDSIPEPFLSIARHCLQRDPWRRWRTSEIAASMTSVECSVEHGH
jgi:serine/threonine protein kinase